MFVGTLDQLRHRISFNIGTARFGMDKIYNAPDPAFGAPFISMPEPSMSPSTLNIGDILRFVAPVDESPALRHSLATIDSFVWCDLINPDPWLQPAPAPSKSIELFLDGDARIEIVLCGSPYERSECTLIFEELWSGFLFCMRLFFMYALFLNIKRTHRVSFGQYYSRHFPRKWPQTTHCFLHAVEISLETVSFPFGSAASKWQCLWVHSQQMKYASSQVSGRLLDSNGQMLNNFQTGLLACEPISYAFVCVCVHVSDV